MRPDDLGHQREPETDASTARPAVAAGEAPCQPLDIGDLDAVAVVDDVDPHLTVSGRDRTSTRDPSVGVGDRVVDEGEHRAPEARPHPSTVHAPATPTGTRRPRRRG